MISNVIESSLLLVTCTWRLFISLCAYYQLNKTVMLFRTISQSHVSGQKELTGRFLGQIAANILKKTIRIISLAGWLCFFSTLVVTVCRELRLV